MTNKSKNNIVVLLHGIFRRAVTVYDLPLNPVAKVERHRVRSLGDIEVFEPEEVWALVRAASPSRTLRSTSRRHSQDSVEAS